MLIIDSYLLNAYITNIKKSILSYLQYTNQFNGKSKAVMWYVTVTLSSNWVFKSFYFLQKFLIVEFYCSIVIDIYFYILYTYINIYCYFPC